MLELTGLSTLALHNTCTGLRHLAEVIKGILKILQNKEILDNSERE